MKRWGIWLIALAIVLNASAHANAQTYLPPTPIAQSGPFAPPMPTSAASMTPGRMPASYPYGPAMAMPPGGALRPTGLGEPTSIAIPMMGGKSAPSGLSVLGEKGPGVQPPPEMLQLRNSPNGFDDEMPAGGVDWNFSAFRIDFLMLGTLFDRNPAFRSNQTAPGTNLFATTEFRNNNLTFVPRLGLDIRLGDYWGLRGSYMKFERQGQAPVTGNGNPNATVITPPTIAGVTRFTQSDQITINSVFIKNVVTSVTQVQSMQVQSPRTFWFLNVVPRTALLPPTVGVPLPPFTLQNAVQAGFPDFLTFDSEVRTEVADFELTHSIELDRATGVMGFGVRYGHVSQSYRATRFNVGGSTTIPGYDPFITLIQDAAIVVNADRESLVYAHTFGGAGPKLSFELGADVTNFARLYSRFNGSLLMGNRKEVSYYQAFSQVTISDIQRIPPADIFYVQNVPAQQTAIKDSFTVVPLGEVEAGVEVAMGGRFFPVFKLGFFGQCWVNGGNATNPNANLFIYGVNASLGIGF